MSFYAIGDIHGRADLLVKLLARLRAAGADRTPLVFVGDYIDRGEDSAVVLDRLCALQSGGWRERVVCLLGNHEVMLLDFLDDPMSVGPAWMHNGGQATLMSFGVPIVPVDAAPSEWEAVRDALRHALGAEREKWLRGLPVSWRTGNVFVSHAGADPRAPLDAQPEAALIWGHQDFERVARRDGTWVVHGHTIRDEVRSRSGRLGVDTGAYATGRLSAVHIKPGEFQVVTT